MADALASGASAARHRSSSLLLGTESYEALFKKNKEHKCHILTIKQRRRLERWKGSENRFKWFSVEEILKPKVLESESVNWRTSDVRFSFSAHNMKNQNAKTKDQRLQNI